jgi:hypothetical protein
VDRSAERIANVSSAFVPVVHVGLLKSNVDRDAKKWVADVDRASVPVVDPFDLCRSRTPKPIHADGVHEAKVHWTNLAVANDFLLNQWSWVELLAKVVGVRVTGCFATQKSKAQQNEIHKFHACFVRPRHAIVHSSSEKLNGIC